LAQRLDGLIHIGVTAEHDDLRQHRPVGTRTHVEREELDIEQDHVRMAHGRQAERVRPAVERDHQMTGGQERRG